MSISDDNAQPADDGLPPVVAGAEDSDEAEDDKDGDEADDSDPEVPES